MTAPHTVQTTNSQAVLYLAFELGWTEWTLGFSTGLAGAPRLRTIRARDLGALVGRDHPCQETLWLTRRHASCIVAMRPDAMGCGCIVTLTAHRVHTLVVDSASIEVKRRGRRPKTDRLDAGKLLTMLIRHCTGEPKVWSVVHVPSVADEDRRQRPSGPRGDEGGADAA